MNQATRSYEMALDRITILQARAVNAFSPAPWTIFETPEGWLVRRGQAVLISTVTKKARLFASVDTAVRRLKAEISATEFKVESAH